MDPIAAATNAVPLQPAQAPQPQAPGDVGATDRAGTAAAEADAGDGAGGQLTDQQLERYKGVAASFVQQMYMTMWREAQRNSSA